MEKDVKALTAKEINKNYSALNKLVVKTEKDIALWLKARGIKGVLTNGGDEHIFGYYMDGSYGIDEVREWEVKAIMLDEEEHIYVVMDMANVIYDKECVANNDYEVDTHSFPIFGGDCMGWFTLIEIAEKLNLYDDEEYYIK